jgi:hypothetical protein
LTYSIKINGTDDKVECGIINAFDQFLIGKPDEKWLEIACLAD